MSHPFSEERLAELNAEIDFLTEVISATRDRPTRYNAVISGSNIYAIIQQLELQRSELQVKAAVLEDYLQE